MLARLKQALAVKAEAKPRKAAPRIPKLAAFGISIVASILIILVLTAGSSPNALANLYLLKASTAATPTPSFGAANTRS